MGSTINVGTGLCKVLYDFSQASLLKDWFGKAFMFCRDDEKLHIEKIKVDAKCMGSLRYFLFNKRGQCLGW